MVRAGEVSGQIDVILVRLADYLEAAEALKREIKSAMTYPVVSLVLVARHHRLPDDRHRARRSSRSSSRLGSELPALTDVRAGHLATSCSANWHADARRHGRRGLRPRACSRRPRRARYAVRLLHAAGCRSSGRCSARSRCRASARTFATLIRSGVPILGTLEIVADTAGNRVIARRRATRARTACARATCSPSRSAQSKVFPPMVMRMIAIGERSGALETLLEKIAEFYDEQVKAAVKALTSLIEPLMIAVMGVIVGGVVLAVFLPILDVVGKLSGESCRRRPRRSASRRDRRPGPGRAALARRTGAPRSAAHRRASRVRRLPALRARPDSSDSRPRRRRDGLAGDRTGRFGPRADSARIAPGQPVPRGTPGRNWKGHRTR